MSIRKVSGDSDGLHIKGSGPFDQKLADGGIRLRVDADGSFELHIRFADLRRKLDRIPEDAGQAGGVGADVLEIYYIANALVDENGMVVRGGQKRASEELGISTSKVSRLTRQITPIGQTRALAWTDRSRKLLKTLLE